MSNDWFTSDWHIGHEKVILFDKRPFNSMEEMKEAIIANHNYYVGPKDNVYCLGDMFFKMDVELIPSILNRLHGRFHIIWGNHDDKYLKKLANCDKISTHHELLYLRLNHERIHMCHYKMTVWRNSHHGSWHLFGHSHGGLNPVQGKCLDVGIMTKGWKPDIPWSYSFDEIKEYMKDRGITHHHPGSKFDDE